jgi:hypothetical protein
MRERSRAFVSVERLQMSGIKSQECIPPLKMPSTRFGWAHRRTFAQGKTLHWSSDVNPNMILLVRVPQKC